MSVLSLRQPMTFEDGFPRVVHLGFYLTMAACTVRMLSYGGGVSQLDVIRLVAVAAFCSLYAGGVAWAKPGRQQVAWLGAMIAAWTPLTLTTPCFSWSAIPLFFLVLIVLPMRLAVPLVGYLAAVAAVVGEFHARTNWDPAPLVAPIAIATMSMFNYRRLHHENVRRQELIDDLMRARDALAESERAAGVLQERVRLSREIHDTLAQGLSSMHMLLNAADQEWDADNGKARAHVRQAAVAARENLAEARRFVHDLAPPALDERSLPEALRKVADSVQVRVEGTPRKLDPGVEGELLRIAQGALANAAQHARAGTVVVTLTYLPDTVTLDVMDDGVGFDPASPSSSRGRGYGLKAIRQRAESLGGTATVDSVPGEGTVVAVKVYA
ncbi:sensor histidine kinase [Nonomuraea sp. NPDC059023]|uniref:sensor histidine kinase n=1 Tax=unclassified Nonomuraea TaxID=2593643 RepID=UPI0036BF5797